jgi:hypothetical protein
MASRTRTTCRRIFTVAFLCQAKIADRSCVDSLAKNALIEMIGPNCPLIERQEPARARCGAGYRFGLHSGRRAASGIRTETFARDGPKSIRAELKQGKRMCHLKIQEGNLPIK